MVWRVSRRPPIHWTLQRFWSLADPATERLRRSDPLNRESVQRRLATDRGDYWICSETGQLAREWTQEDHESEAMYDDDWSELPTEAEFQARVDGMAKRLAPYEPYRKTGHLFEVGAGQGAFLKAARLRGWQATGNELSPVGAKQAEDASGSPVLVGPMESIELEPERYDVFLMNNVFEHLVEPYSVLCKLARALRPGGVIFIHTGNASSLSLWARPQHWVYFHPGHLHFPTLDSLSLYCDAAGLELAELKTHGFRSARTKEERGGLRKPFDKLISTFAGRVDLGHRLRCLLRRPG